MRQSVRNTIYVSGAAIVVIALFVFAMIEGGFLSWFLCSSFLIITLYIVCAYFYPIHTWKVKRITAEQTYMAGDHIHISIQIKRAIPFPLFYAFFEEELPPSLQRIDQSNEKFTLLGVQKTLPKKESFVGQILILFKRTIHLEYNIPYVARGAHELRAIKVQSSDLLGCIKKETVFPCAEEIHVFPRIRSLAFAHGSPSFQQGEEVSLSILKGIQSTLTSSVREYISGDRMSWIDWKQTAKQNEVMTKEFERERDLRVLFIFDHLAYATMNELAFEGTVETTVALVEQVTNSATEVDFLSIGREAIYRELDQTGVQHDWFSDHMMRVQPEAGSAFTEQLKEYAFYLGKRALTCVITTQLSDETVRILSQVKQHSGEILFIYVTAKTGITGQMKHTFESMQMEGIRLSVLTEDELVTDPLEVIEYGTT